MRKTILFDSWHQWKVCFLSGCSKFAWGLARIVSCIILGVASIICWLWQLLLRAVSRYPVPFVCAAAAACFAAWCLTYVSMKGQVAAAQDNRDSMAYKLRQYTTMYDGDTDSLIVIRKDKTSYVINIEENK